MKISSIFVAIILSLSVSARPQLYRRQKGFALQNGEDAIALNNKFQTLNANSPCNVTSEANACVGDQFAQCVNGNFVLTSCSGGTVCRALPLVNSPGTSITCTTVQDANSRIAATGATSANTTSISSSNPSANNTSGPQTSLTLDPKVIAQGFENDGQGVPTPGQVASLTSSNNFINFCLTSNKPIGNGQQVQGGSCNPAPMGIIAATSNIPSSKFIFPTNNGKVQANTTFTIKMAINHMSTGNFVNPDSNYLAAPQQVDSNGDIIGHSHVVIEQIQSLTSTALTDPTKFAFFKGLNAAANNGVLTTDVTGGLAPGVYRLASINTAANHQPVLVAVAQHGSLDDQVYFTVM